MTTELNAAIIATILFLYPAHAILWMTGIFENTVRTSLISAVLAGLSVVPLFLAFTIKEHYIQNIEHYFLIIVMALLFLASEALLGMRMIGKK